MKITFLDAEILKDVYRQTTHVLWWPITATTLGILLLWFFAIQYRTTSSHLLLIITLSFLIVILGAKHYLKWYKTRYLITNQRLIKIEHDGLFKYTVTETTHDRILNIGYKTTGFISAVGRFGDVEVQAVGLVEPIVLSKVHQPEIVKNYIWLMHTRYKDHLNTQDIGHIQEQIGYTKKDQRIL